MDKYQPEYNTDVRGWDGRKIDRKKKYNKDWSKKRRPKTIREKNTIKCRNVETGKLKTLHGWSAVSEYGDLGNIKRAIRNNTIAYGYYWWIHKKASVKRPVYGINRDGDRTKVFESVVAGMRAFDEDDRGKGICTSIKWGNYWRGYRWYYALEE
jgi:hypothetical protein